jgi:DnaJ domain
MRTMDPHAVLGVAPGASRRDVTAAYRRLAREWHPDRRAGEDAVRRMAEINGAYDLLRAEAWLARARPPQSAARPDGNPLRGGVGAWLAPAIRRALGRELLGVLEPGEPVWLVTPATTWASPQCLLAASDRRLLWLLDDAVNNRVQTLRYAAVVEVDHRVRRPRRRVATLRVRAWGGRRHEFADLRPATALAVARRISAAHVAPPRQRTELA